MHTTTHNEQKLSDRFVAAINISWQVLAKVSESFGTSRFFLHLSGKTRRLFLVHFSQDYVRDQLSARQGECRQCGTCCNLLFTCPALTKDGGCSVYGICRPQACKVFPIDQRDIDEAASCGGQCGYYFKNRAIENSCSQKKA